MKVAFFSPFPPKQTGVAAYSKALVSAMRGVAQVTAFDYNNAEFVSNDPDAVDFQKAPEVLARLGDWDTHIFSLGNNPHFHLEILKAYTRTGGILLLHDTVLYFLFAGLSSAAFYKEFCLNFGPDRAGEIAKIYDDSIDRNILRYRHPERYPFLRTPLQRAETVIVHSRHAAEIVRAAVPEVSVEVIPHLALVAPASEERAARAKELRTSLEGKATTVFLGTFGFIGPTKRLASVAKALARLPAKLDFRFVIVGEGPDPMPDFAEAGVADRVVWIRYVPDQDYDAWIEAVDVVLNLRFPSMGESSGTLTRAMGMGKACVVTNHGTFSELPDDTVSKIPSGDAEIDSLVSAITSLAKNKGRRVELGTKACEHVRRENAPEHVASRLLDIARGQIRKKAHLVVSKTKTDPASSATIHGLVASALHAALPEHLRDVAALPNTSLPSPMPLGLTYEQVLWAYRILLMREPNSAAEIQAVLRNIGSLQQLRKIMFDSEEFKRLPQES